MKELSLENLKFMLGDESFEKEDFLKMIQPYFKDLSRHDRTNFLFVATYGDGSKPDVTGYNTSTTINATINSFAAKSTRTNGKWAVYELN